MAPFAPPEEIRALPRQYGIFEGSVLNCTHTSGLARKSIFQDITQVIVIKQTIEHDF